MSIPAFLVLAALVIGRAFLTTPHHLPGRALLLVDAALAVLTGAGRARIATALPVARAVRIAGAKKGRPSVVVPRHIRRDRVAYRRQ